MKDRESHRRTGFGNNEAKPEEEAPAEVRTGEVVARDGLTPGTDSGAIRIVDEGRMADLLTDPATLRQLEPFLGRDVSVGEAAAQTDQKPNTMLSRVRRLVAAGILRETGRVRRRGRPIRLYRSIADTFFIPFDVTSAESLESSLAEREAYWERLLRRNVVRARQERVGVWGTRIYRDDRGRLQIQTAVRPDRNYTTLDPDGPAVLSAWRDSLFLDFEDAKTLQREMFDLLKKYQQKQGAQRYILHLGLAPIAD